MALGDLLKDIGQGVATGAKAVGAVAAPLAERTAQVVSGQAPQIDAEQRKQQQALEDAQINIKSQQLEQQLAMGQKYGTLTPQQQQQYIDQITGLYSHPRHAGTLMEKLRQAIHPNGAVAQGPQAPLPDATPQGGTLAADEQAQQKTALIGDQLKQAEARKQAVATADFLVSQLPPGTSDADKAAYRNNALEHLLHVATGKPPEAKGMKAIGAPGGAVVGVEDQDTHKQYLPEQLAPGGDAPPQAKAMWAAIQKAEKDKQTEIQKKADEVQRRQDEREARTDNRQIRSENFQESMMGLREQEAAYKKLDDQANVSQGMVDNYKEQYSDPTTNKSAIDQQLVSDYTGLLARGGRKNKAEYDVARNIGSFQMNLEQKYKKFTTGELPEELRKMYLDYINLAAKAQRSEAEQAKPQPPSTGARKVGDMLPKTGAKPVGSADPEVDAIIQALKKK